MGNAAAARAGAATALAVRAVVLAACQCGRSISLRQWGWSKTQVDLLELDGFGAIAHGLEQGAEAEVSGLAQAAFGGGDDEAERVVGGPAALSTSPTPVKAYP